MDQVYQDGLIKDGVVSIAVDIDTSRFEEESWPPQMTDGGFIYLNAATCPDCGSGMVRLGSCFNCPVCGWGGCGVF